MLDRGVCHFVEKVRHAQMVGADAVVIVNNIEGNSLPVMADDGSAGACGGVCCLTPPPYPLPMCLDGGGGLVKTCDDTLNLRLLSWLWGGGGVKGKG
jgi:hypothetical protein